MWKANGKTATLSLFLDSLFPVTEKNAGLECFVMWCWRRMEKRVGLVV
jgi:hypothetical protein